MKTSLATSFIVFAAALAVPAIAADTHNSHGAMPGMGMSASNHGAMPMAAADSQMVDGTVKKVDKSAGKVTLAHGPLANLGMNMNMTMVFRVKDVAWLDQMKEGDKIRFVADKVGGAFTVIAFEPAK